MSDAKVFPTTHHNTFVPQEIPSPFSTPSANDLLLGMQALGLCNLTYNNQRLTEKELSKAVLKTHWFSFINPLTKHESSTINRVAVEIENNSMKFAKVEREDFKLWNETFKGAHNAHKKHFLKSQCVTGVIDLATSPDDAKNLVPFIAFRGSVSTVDWLRDAASSVPIEYVSEKGNKSNGKVGLGFAGMIQHLKKIKQDDRNFVEELLRLIAKYDNGFIITGHSLGGGCTNIFLLEMMLDHMDLIEKYQSKVRVITFGSPRSFSAEIVASIHSLPIQYLRFINNDDLITALPPKMINLYFHPGKALYPYLASDVTTLRNTKDPTGSLPDWKTILTKQQEATVLWLQIFDPSNAATAAYDNFSADPKTDSGFASTFDLPKGFSGKYYKTHDIIDKIGYDRMFANLLQMEGVVDGDALLGQIGQLAKTFREVEEMHAQLISKELHITLGL